MLCCMGGRGCSGTVSTGPVQTGLLFLLLLVVVVVVVWCLSVVASGCQWLWGGEWRRLLGA